MTSSESPRKILILDDEPHVVTYLETLLKDNGYDTVTARDGNEGLEKAKREKPDLITLDISMPEKSGVRFYRDLKSDPATKDIPVLVVTAVTGYAGDPYAFQKFIGERKSVPPPEGYLPKPIDQDEFLGMVESILNKKEVKHG